MTVRTRRNGALALILGSLMLAADSTTGWAQAPAPTAQLSPQQRNELMEKVEEFNKLQAECAELHAKGAFHEAIPVYLRLADIFRNSLRGEKHPTYGVILNNLARLYTLTGEYTRAEPLFKEAIEISVKTVGREHPNYTLCLSNMALLYGSTGDYARAKSLFQEALEIRKKTVGDAHPDYATSLNNLGMLYHDMGEYTRAQPLLQQALEIRKKTVGEEHPDYAESLNNLALLYESLADYPRAELLYQQASECFEKTIGREHPRYAVVLGNLGLVYWKMGEYRRAESLYQQALQIQKKVIGEDHPDYATSLNNLAHLYESKGEYAKALPLFLQVLERAIDEEHPDRAISLSSVARIYSLVGKHARAEPLLQQACEITKKSLGEEHPRYAQNLADLGWLYYLIGEYDRAERLLQQALEIDKRNFGEEHPEYAGHLQGLILVYAATSRWPEAVTSQDQAYRIQAHHVASVLPVLPERTQLTFLNSAFKGQLYGSLSLGLICRSDQRAASLSAAWLLNGKAIAHRILAEREFLARASNSDPNLAETVRQLLAVRTRLAGLALQAPALQQPMNRVEDFKQLQQQQDELTRHLAQAQSKLRRHDDRWIELDEVRNVLPAASLLIDIVRFRLLDFQALRDRWGSEHYGAWLVPPAGMGDIRLLDLGEAERIDEAAQEVRKTLQAAMDTIREQGEPEAEKLSKVPLQQLAKIVLEPILNQIGDVKQLIVSPDGALWLVPWEAFPLADGRYAVENYQIHYVVSGRDLVTQQPVGLASNQPVIMANPDFDLDPVEAQSVTRAALGEPESNRSDELRSFGPMATSSALPRVAQLPYTAAEAELISPALERYADEEPKLYTDRYALEGLFKSLERPRVVVLSTHGFFLEDQEVKEDDRMLASTETRHVALRVDGQPIENPLLRCGLLLAGCNQSGAARSAGIEDGVLTGMEIVGTDFRGTELVVLSACETGLGQVRNGEGVAGLRQAFQLAGAKAVVATLWQVSDRESARLMTTFFENLATGQTKADALRNAQLKMIEYRRSRYGSAHPFFWAAFTYAGPIEEGEASAMATKEWVLVTSDVTNLYDGERVVGQARKGQTLRLHEEDKSHTQFLVDFDLDGKEIFGWIMQSDASRMSEREPDSSSKSQTDLMPKEGRQAAGSSAEHSAEDTKPQEELSAGRRERPAVQKPFEDEANERSESSQQRLYGGLVLGTMACLLCVFGMLFLRRARRG